MKKSKMNQKKNNDFISKIQKAWEEYFPTYPPLNRHDIAKLMSGQYTASGDLDDETDFLCEAFAQATVINQNFNTPVINPIGWIWVGLNRGSLWLWYRTRIALAEKKEATIRAGDRGDNGFQSLKNIFDRAKQAEEKQ